MNVLQILVVVLLAWWVVHFVSDLFGGTPGAHKHKDLGGWNVGSPIMRDYKEDLIDQHLASKEKALILAWVGWGLVGLMMWGVGALAYTMLWLK